MKALSRVKRAPPALLWKEDNDQNALHRSRCAAAGHFMVRNSATTVCPRRLIQEGRVGLLEAASASSQNASAAFDLRDVVDLRLDAGLHPAQLVDRTRRPSSAQRRFLQPATSARAAGQRHRTLVQRVALSRGVGSARRSADGGGWISAVGAGLRSTPMADDAS